MIMPDRAMIPSCVTKPSGRCNSSKNMLTPIMPSGAVSNTRTIREMLCNWNISSNITTPIKIG